MWSQNPSNRQQNRQRPPSPTPPGMPPMPPGPPPGGNSNVQGGPPKKTPPGQSKNPSAAPTTPPPNFVPAETQATPVKSNQPQGKSQGPGSQGPTLKAVDPGAIFPCLYRYVYIWPRFGPGYWMYVTYVGRYSVAGWRYYRRRWIYYSTDLRNIRSFYCY